MLGKRRQETFRHTTLLFHQHTAAGDSLTWVWARKQRDVPSSHHRKALSHFILTKLHIPNDAMTASLISQKIETHDTPKHSQAANSVSCIVRSTHTNRGHIVLFWVQWGYLQVQWTELNEVITGRFTKGHLLVKSRRFIGKHNVFFNNIFITKIRKKLQYFKNMWVIQSSLSHYQGGR